MRQVEIVPIQSYSGIPSNRSVDDWVKEQFSFQYLSDSTPLEKPFDGFDTMLLLSWVRQKFSASVNQSFVLHYWDLRLSNIMVDEDDNLVGYIPPCYADFKSIIDWDDVGTVPLKLSAISIAESFAPRESRLQLDPETDDLFRKELCRLELENSSSTEWSQMFLHSRENSFLFDILRVGHNFIKLRENYPDLFEEALLRNPERLSQAATEWKEFVREKYLSKGLDTPNYPRFVQIQEELGLCGQSKLGRIKKYVQKHWKVLVDKFNAWRSNQPRVLRGSEV